MLILNNKKFARNDKEFTSSLFESGGTCVGYYKPNKTSITIYNMQKEKIGVITKHKVLACATPFDGAWWYSYATIKEVGEYDSYSHSMEDIEKALEDNNIKSA